MASMKKLAIGSVELEYWEGGTGASVVFVHGVATSGDLWAADLAELAADLRLIVYNRRGYGGSSSSPRSWDAHTHDAIALVEHLNAAPAVVVGYSGGAMVALGMALTRPDLIAHLVLLDPAWNLRRCLTPGFVGTLAAMKLVRRVRGDRHAAEHWLRYVSSYSTGGSAYETRASPARRDALLANAGGIFADFASGGGSVDEGRVADIAVPVTIVDGRLSPSFLRRSSRRLGRLLPRARRMTLAHSGHWFGVDARAELLEILREAAR